MATTSNTPSTRENAIRPTKSVIEWATQGEPATIEEFQELVKRAEESSVLSEEEFTEQMNVWRKKMF